MGKVTTEPGVQHSENNRTTRLVQAGMVGASVAMPDYVSSRAGRIVANAALAMGGGSLLGLLVSREGEPAEDSAVMFDRLRQAIGNIGNTDGPDSDTPAGVFDLDSPVRTWLTLAAVLLSVFALSRLDAAARRWLVRRLQARGVRRPHTLVGVIAAGVTFLLSEASHRNQLPGA